MSGHRVALDRWGYTPGETVGGYVQPERGARSIRIGLVRGDRTTNQGALAPLEGAMVSHAGPFDPGAWIRFDFGIPADAVPSLVAGRGDIFWAIEVTERAPHEAPSVGVWLRDPLFGGSVLERIVVAETGSHGETLRYSPW